MNKLTPFEFLASLGDTSEAVAAKLEDMGVTGNLEEASSCPIANVLHREYGGSWDICCDKDGTVVHIPPGVRQMVSDDAGEFNTRAFPWELSSLRVAVPETIPQFVRDFDSGAYPQLRADDPDEDEEFLDDEDFDEDDLDDEDLEDEDDFDWDDEDEPDEEEEGEEPCE